MNNFDKVLLIIVTATLTGLMTCGLLECTEVLPFMSLPTHILALAMFVEAIICGLYIMFRISTAYPNQRSGELS